MTRLVYPSQIQLIYGRCLRQRHQHPACGGQGLRRTRPFWLTAISGPCIFSDGPTWIHQDLIRALEEVLSSDSMGERHQALFMTAPSMTTPALTYFHSATSSLRASATIVAFFRRPPLCLTRSRNHKVSADRG